MLNISWLDYFKTILAIGTVYYLVTFLLFYGSEIREKVTGKSSATAPDFSEEEKHSNDSVIGSIKPDDADDDQDHLSSEQIQIADDPDTSDKSMLAASVTEVTELLEQAKSLTTAIIEDRASKEESFELIKGLLARFSHLKDSPYQSSVELFIHSNLSDLPAEITLAELRTLWP